GTGANMQIVMVELVGRLSYFFDFSRAHRDLHSFPTRRSSDLNGDVAPRGRIAGPKTGITDEPWQMEFYKGRIFLAASNHFHQNLYDGVTLRPDATDVPDDPWLNPILGFMGIWNITDNGDVAPLAMIRGPFSGLIHPVGLALNPKDGEVYVSDSLKNGVLSFLVPQFFPQQNANLNFDGRQSK